MTTLDKAYEHFGSWRQIAKFLEVDQSFIYQVRKKQRPLPAYMAAKLAAEMGYDPIIETLWAHEQSAKSKEEKEFWRGNAQKLSKQLKVVLHHAAVIALFCITATLWSPPSSAGNYQKFAHKTILDNLSIVYKSALSKLADLRKKLSKAFCKTKASPWGLQPLYPA